MKPTDEQLKKFWEWCGIKPVKYKDCYIEGKDNGYACVVAEKMKIIERMKG